MQLFDEKDKLRDTIRHLNCDFADFRLESHKSVKRLIPSKGKIEETRSIDSGGFIRLWDENYCYLGRVHGGNELVDILHKKKYNNLIKNKSQGVASGVPIVMKSPPSKTNPRSEFLLKEMTNSLKNVIRIATKIGFKISGVAKIIASQEQKIILNTEGTSIEKYAYDIYGGFNVLWQDSTFSLPVFFGANRNILFEQIWSQSFWEKQAKYMEEVKQSSPHQKSGSVIFSPAMASLFIHEIVGHTFEADNQYIYPSLGNKLRRGELIASPLLSVYDYGGGDMRGYTLYDDEGIKSKKIYLIRDGIAEERMHTRETAFVFGEEPTGNGRAINHKHLPICRMRNTCVEEGNSSLDDMLQISEKGIYVDLPYGGKPHLKDYSFVLGAMKCYAFEKGRITTSLGPLKIIGNIFDALKGIQAVGTKSEKDSSSFGCGKGGQKFLKVGQSAPHILVNNLITLPLF